MEISNVVNNVIQATSIKYNNLVYELKQQGKSVIVLSLGEAFFDIPLLNFQDLPFPNIYHYSHSRGIPELRNKLCEYYSKFYNVSVDAEKEIIVTAGSKIAIYFVFQSLLNSNDEVIIPEPAWVSYTEQVKLCSANPITIPYWEKVYNFEKYITEKTKIIVINNPNNPSGKVYSKHELEFLLALAQEKNIYILSDEAYSDFLVDDKFYSLGYFDQNKNNIIICNSISKNFGISGWRIGYTITNKNLTNELLKLNQHLITCAPTILEYYLAQYFDQIIDITYPQIKKIVQTRNQIANFMDLINLKYLPGTSTFYFFVSIAPSKLNSEDFCTKLLLEENISTVPGIGYGKSCDSFIRVSVGTESEETIKYALKKIQDLIKQTS
ncbi:pyridoxal phosphate-dependent aminotransferase [Candidatus Babeliales bacterium]|nr:pyridoxal phosphate-dependent aminotransferase [Candidatus Babeliales bacterium]